MRMSVWYLTGKRHVSGINGPQRCGSWSYPDISQWACCCYLPREAVNFPVLLPKECVLSRPRFPWHENSVMEGRCSVSKKSPGSYSSYQGFLLNSCTSALEPLMAMNDHTERYLRLSVFTVWLPKQLYVNQAVLSAKSFWMVKLLLE